MAESPDLLLKFFQQRHMSLLLQDCFLLCFDTILSGSIHGNELKQEHSHYNQCKEKSCITGIRGQVREQNLLQRHYEHKRKTDYQCQDPPDPAAEHGSKIPVELGPFQNSCHKKGDSNSQRIWHNQTHENQKMLPVKQRRVFLHYIQHGIIGSVYDKGTQNGSRKGIQQRNTMNSGH